MISITQGRSSFSNGFRPRVSGSCVARIAFAIWAGLLGGCGDGTGPGEPLPDLAVDVVASGLSSPLYLTAPRGDARLFVVEQPGRIRIIESGALRATPFLDITDRVLYGGERGLLSVAFHPSYATDGYFYVYYTDATGDIRIERYRVSGDPDVADRASAKAILSVSHRLYSNHNGGLIHFGSDGMLYLGTGDGGGGGDPERNGQDRGELLGKLLRIDVDRGDPYAIPPDNPFVNQTGARGEIWAWGLRNPWRFAFDREDGTLYIADVGQNAWEEVDAVPATAAGLNYGWVIMEGPVCYGAATCDQTGLTLPVVSYGRSDGCSVIGGFPYRGERIPGAVGHYFYSDLCGGWLRSFRLVAGQPEELREWSVGDLGSVLSFGEDAAGELYILSANGRVYRLILGA